jgi:hypothetical protein
VTMYCTKYAVKEGALISWKLNKGCDYQRFLQVPSRFVLPSPTARAQL